MYLVLETFTVTAYMFDGRIGFLAMCILMCADALKNKGEKYRFTRWLRLMILSLPMGFIGFLGVDMHQILSWYNLYLVMFLLSFMMDFRFLLPVDALGFLCTTAMLSLTLCTILWEQDLTLAFIERMQVLIMIVPLLLLHGGAKHIKYRNAAIDTPGLFRLMSVTCVSTSLATLLQFAAHRIFGLELGITNLHGGGRICYDCLFKGASILPIFLGTGFLICFINLLDKAPTIKTALSLAVIFCAMVVNSSRTGIFSALIVSAALFFIKISKKITLKDIVLFFLFALGASGGIAYLLHNRSNLSGFLDANGRTETFQNAFLLLSDMRVFFLGDGFTRSDWNGAHEPHNFFLQTLLQGGIVAFVLLVCLIGKYLWDNRRNRYVFIALHLFLAGMLVTDFYANPFNTVSLIIVDLYDGYTQESAFAFHRAMGVLRPVGRMERL